MATYSQAPDGTITLNTEYANPPREQVIPAGTDPAVAQSEVNAFYAADLPDKAQVLQRFSDLSGFPVSVMTALFNGTLT